MATGRVRWFDDQKGYGFIREDGTEKDIFAHYSDVQGSGFKSLAEGEKLEFEIVQTEKGRKAQKITRLAGVKA